MTTTHTDAAPRVLIISSRFYTHLAEWLEDGAKDALTQANVAYDLVEVPGALEIPAVIALAEQHKKYAGYVALGCVIRGETTHYDLVCEQSAAGLMQLSLRGLAIGNGILTVENEQQAIERANKDELNKGGGAAEAALALMHICQQFSA